MDGNPEGMIPPASENETPVGDSEADAQDPLEDVADENATDGEPAAPEPKDYSFLGEYKCHKVVRAGKITGINPRGAGNGQVLLHFENGSSTNVNSAWIKRHNAVLGGYFVVYEDGYTSFSPAKPFEEGYSHVSDD